MSCVCGHFGFLIHTIKITTMLSRFPLFIHVHFQFIRIFFFSHFLCLILALLLYLPEENTFYILSPFKTSYFIISYLPFKLLICQFMNTAYRCIIFIPCHAIFYKISIQPYSKLSDNRNI